MTKTVALLPELVERVDAIISKQRDHIAAMEAEYGGGIPDDQCGVVLNFRDLIDLRAAIEATQTDLKPGSYFEAMKAASDEIQQLREEVERLREAIKPFAQLFDLRWAQYPVAPDNAPISLGFALHGKKRSGDLELSDFRRARSSLSSSSLTNG